MLATEPPLSSEYLFQIFQIIPNFIYVDITADYSICIISKSIYPYFACIKKYNLFVINLLIYYLY